MMYMYPGFNSFEGENSFVQAQGFAFQQFHQQQNWNLYNQLTIDPFILETNNNLLNSLVPTDQDFVNYNFQQNLDFNGFNEKKGSNHIYSKYTIPSITSIISQHATTNNINPMNFLPLSTTNNMITPSPIISSIPTKSSIGIDFNYNENTNLLTQSQSQPQLQSQNSIQSSDTLSYFVTPDKDTTISLQDILDGMKVMQEISNDLTIYNSNTDNNLLQDITNNLVDENSIDWLIQDNWKETLKEDETYEFKGKSSEKKQDEIFCQEVDDLIEEHMKEIKKVVHNEILCQEILTESSSFDYQDFKNFVETEDSNLSSIAMTTTTIDSQDIIIKQEVISQEISQEISQAESSSSSSSNIFVPQEINFTHGMLTTNLVNQRTLKCDEVGCSKEYNCYAKLKTHKITHTNERPFMCNVLGCNKKFKRSGELIKHQLDHLIEERF